MSPCHRCPSTVQYSSSSLCCVSTDWVHFLAQFSKAVYSWTTGQCPVDVLPNSAQAVDFSKQREYSTWLWSIRCGDVLRRYPWVNIKRKQTINDRERTVIWGGREFIEPQQRRMQAILLSWKIKAIPKQLQETFLPKIPLRAKACFFCWVERDQGNFGGAYRYSIEQLKGSLTSIISHRISSHSTPVPFPFGLSSRLASIVSHHATSYQ